MAELDHKAIIIAALKADPQFRAELREALGVDDPDKVRASITRAIAQNSDAFLVKLIEAIKASSSWNQSGATPRREVPQPSLPDQSRKES